jgi:signal peptide peptidase SppA
MKYAHLIAEFYSRVWAIRPEKLAAIDQLIRMRAAGEKFTAEEIRERIGADAGSKRPRASTPGTVALIPIVGVISHRMNLMSEISGPGGTSIQQLTSRFRAAMDDASVKAIIFDVDSPGGSVDGVPELAAEIYNGRSKKKIIAVANTMSASAAYWLASSAGELIVTPSGAVGSIGVFAAHEDMSKALEAEGVKVTLVSAGKYKTEGNPYEPLSDDAREELQSKVESYYSSFTKAVAQNRGVKAADVRGGFGQGRMVLAADAVKEGMADRVATLDEVLAKYGVSNPRTSGASASSSSSAAQAGDMGEECSCNCSACKACDFKGSMKTAAAAETPIDDTVDDDADDDGTSCKCKCTACMKCEMKPANSPSSKAEHPAITRRRLELALHK